MDIHTNSHSVKHLCTSTSSANTKLFGVSFSRKEDLYWKELRGYFVWLCFFSCYWRGRSILTIRGKILKLSFFPGTVPKLNHFYIFPVRHFFTSILTVSTARDCDFCLNLQTGRNLFGRFFKKKIS